MIRQTKITILVCILALISVVLVGCSRASESQAAKDEIMLKIQLDLNEDIGLLVIDHDVDGKKGSGGMSNADKSMLKRNDVLDWSFDKQLYDHSADTVDLTVRFTVVTEYCDPNYENIYPEEYMVPMEALSFKANFGETYSITITGDKVNGYQAALNDLD